MTQLSASTGTAMLQVDELTSIDRAVFLEKYRFRKPFVLRGGARRLPAFGKWTLDYLENCIGDVIIQPLSYEEDERDYSQARFVEMPFRKFCQELRAGTGKTLYWFTGPQSENFWGGPGKHADGKGALQSLGADFEPPGFLHESELIYAQMILGTGRNGTVAHYDFGGEAKCLMQLIGEKHVLLVPPQYGRQLAPQSIAEDGNFTVSTLDLRGRDARFIRASVPVFEAKVRAGDVLYWPSFWLHDIANAGDINLAINAPIDEVPMSPLLLRHLLAMNLRHLRRLEPDLQIDDALMRRAEQQLLDCTEITTLWEAHSALMRLASRGA